METMKVKPWHESQGDHVLINAADFDPAVHQLHGVEEAAPEANQVAAEDAPKRRGRPPKSAEAQS